MNKIDAVWELKQKGLKHSEIASALGLATSTVNTYVANMKNRVQPLPQMPSGPIATTVERRVGSPPATTVSTSGSSGLPTLPTILPMPVSSPLEQQLVKKPTIDLTVIDITEEDCQDFYASIFAKEGAVSEMIDYPGIGVSEGRCKAQGSRLYRIFKRHGFTWEYFEELVFGLGLTQDVVHMTKQVMKLRKQAKDIQKQREEQNQPPERSLQTAIRDISKEYDIPKTLEPEKQVGDDFMKKITGTRKPGEEVV